MEQPVRVYVIQSQTTEEYYCDLTIDVNHRLDQHNSPRKENLPTDEMTGPWKLKWKRSCNSRGEAIHLKRMIEGKGIENFLEEQEE